MGRPRSREQTAVASRHRGVFAIAITLLVLEIQVPPTSQIAGPDRLPSALADLWPSYVGYVISFVTVGIIWANHTTCSGSCRGSTTGSSWPTCCRHPRALKRAASSGVSRTVSEFTEK